MRSHMSGQVKGDVEGLIPLPPIGPMSSLSVGSRAEVADKVVPRALSHPDALAICGVEWLGLWASLNYVML